MAVSFIVPFGGGKRYFLHAKIQWKAVDASSVEEAVERGIVSYHGSKASAFRTLCRVFGLFQ